MTIMARIREQKGFTIVELMIATAVFSMVLLLLAAAIVHIGRIYYKGAITNRVQETSRSIADEVAQAVQFSRSVPRPSSGTVTPGVASAYCIEGVRYTYMLDRAQGTGTGQSRHVLWRDYGNFTDACQPANLSAANPSSGCVGCTGGQELLGDAMRLQNFKICTGTDGGCEASEGMWSIVIIVAYGTDDVFDGNGENRVCKGQNFGGQFCALSRITTQVTKKLNG